MLKLDFMTKKTEKLVRQEITKILKQEELGLSDGILFYSIY